MGDQTVMTWWTGLCCLAFVNFCLLLLIYRMHQRQKMNMSKQMIQLRNWMFILATLYTLGCGFRSVFPRGDLLRIVLYDSWISSVVIGRTVATIAELSFVAQWSLLLHEIGTFSSNKRIILLSKIPLPMIVIAELFSWYACITTNYFGTIIEESLWAVAAAITVYGFLLARAHYVSKQRTYLQMGIVTGCLYVLYMVLVDVPAYISKWSASEAVGRVYYSIYDGLIDVSTRWHYTRAFEDWQYEMVWMSLYFSVAVWISMYMVVAPTFETKLEGS
jgi:hypothetical protein